MLHVTKYKLYIYPKCSVNFVGIILSVFIYV